MSQPCNNGSNEFITFDYFRLLPLLQFESIAQIHWILSLCRLHIEYARIWAKQGNKMDCICIDAALRWKKKLLIDRNGVRRQSSASCSTGAPVSYLCSEEIWGTHCQKQLSVFWGGDEQRDTVVYIDAATVDHPQLDKLTGCPGAVFSNTL